MSQALAKATTTKQTEPETTTKPKIQWNEGIELRGFWLPYHMASNGNQSVCVGNHFASGLKVSGVVRRITMLPSQIVRVLIEVDSKAKRYGAIVFTSGGLYAEVDDTNYEVAP